MEVDTPDAADAPTADAPHASNGDVPDAPTGGAVDAPAGAPVDAPPSTNISMKNMVRERALRLMAAVRVRLTAMQKAVQLAELQVARIARRERANERGEKAIAAGKRLRDDGAGGAEAESRGGKVAHGQSDDAPSQMAVDAGKGGGDGDGAGGGEDSGGGEARRGDAARQGRQSHLPADGQAKVRNRKMFGMLVGTLTQARKEGASSRSCAAQLEKLQQVEERLRADRCRSLDEARGRLAEAKAEAATRLEAATALRDELEALTRELEASRDEAMHTEHMVTEAEPRILYKPHIYTPALRSKHDEQARATLAALVEALEALEARVIKAAAEAEAFARGEGSAAGRGGARGSGGGEVGMADEPSRGRQRAGGRHDDNDDEEEEEDQDEEMAPRIPSAAEETAEPESPT